MLISTDIQEFYETTLLDEGKSSHQKTHETLEVAHRWENTDLLYPSALIGSEFKVSSNIKQQKKTVHRHKSYMAIFFFLEQKTCLAIILHTRK